ncbi:metallophosphoesterase family protein [Desulfocurvibacter africanus]|uniref:Metallophosphoesterase n=1 Tax=Desulfocurvibacter africanus subsp. africanus str. Walvis Bay TaxID=690850 RepID=F3Z0D5_DESAF|nr:metallophosphoesterase [Desulfocurvibacter africanus]EGJ50945.1 metallophosphoesterase [Desulfocurvibacter africanus subsp. africanus str. Walvis Bay]
MKRMILAAVLLAFALCASAICGYQLLRRGGFDDLPPDNQLPALRVTESGLRLHSAGSFTFAVLGDMRWDSSPRIATLEAAQEHAPLFMVNLGDVVEFARADEWQKYIQELTAHWRQDIRYFHIPGGHSLNVRLSGVRPHFYDHYFGKTYYYVDTDSSWRFIFLDASLPFIGLGQHLWLRNTLKDAQEKGMKIVMFMHHPPRDEQRGAKKALLGASTWLLAKSLEGYRIQAIFAAHIHKTFDFNWNGIPVYITSLNPSTWKGMPTYYRLVHVEGDSLKVEVRQIDADSHAAMADMSS